jgi:hypothetical protein
MAKGRGKGREGEGKGRGRGREGKGREGEGAKRSLAAQLGFLGTFHATNPTTCTE